MTASHAQWEFEAYRLDPSERQLWREDELVPLRPKLFAALAYLVEHSGRLVTRDELLRAVWSRTHVNEALLRGVVRDIRTALGDDAERPRFVETIPHQGYRFVAAVRRLVPRAATLSSTASDGLASTMVERGAEFTELDRLLTRAMGRQRQLAFVTGEAGIGKSTLVDAFVSTLPARHGVAVARGQCVEQYGAGEPFLPLLEAVTHLCRGRMGKRAVAALTQFAPTWMVQLPALLAGAELDRLLRLTQSAGRDRMLREMAEALEALSVDVPIVLVLEDLHWSDPSTIDVLGALARRREAARLLVLGTYRPADAIVARHPLRALTQELLARRLATELSPGYLTPAGVSQYLAARFGAGSRDGGPDRSAALAALAVTIHRRSDGNPLFVVTLVDYLVEQGVLGADGTPRSTAGLDHAAAGVPDGLRQLIERHFEQLAEPDQRLLEVASVAGVTFRAGAVAAGLGAEAADVDERCNGIATRGLFLERDGGAVLLDGGDSSHYRFRHALYQQVLYDRLSSGRLARLHRVIGDSEEAAWGARASDHATALAMHFERAHEFVRAAGYFAVAARGAMARSAFHESVISCAHGMALLERLAPGPERDTLTQGLLLQELAVRIMTTGYASEATTLTAARLRDSMQERGAPTGVLPVAVLTVGRFDYVRGDFEGATACGRHGLVLAPSPDHPLALLAHTLLCCVAYQCGDYRQSVAHAEHVAAHYDVQRHGRMALDATDDPFVVTRNYGGGSLVALGLLDQARACLRTAVSTAESLAIPFCVAFAHMSGSWSYLACQDVASARRALDVTEALAGQHGFGYLVAQAATLRAWVDLLDGRARDSDGWQALLARFDAGLEAIDATGIVVGRPVLQAGQAVAAYHAGDAARAFGLLEAAIGDATNAGAWNDVMAPRITKGDLHAGRREWQAALSEYEAVVALASRLGATLYQLIATARVVRLSRATRRLPGVDRQAALTRLAEVLGGLTEGFDLPLVHEAQSLLAAAPDPAPASPRVRL